MMMSKKKNGMKIETDEMVGLTLEWAESYNLPEWIEKLIIRLQTKYDYDEPDEQEKIAFLTVMAESLPNTYHRDLIKKFLEYYENDEDDEDDEEGEDDE